MTDILDMACLTRIKERVRSQGTGVGRNHEVKKISRFGSLAESNGCSGDVLSDSRRIKEDTMLTRCFILIGLIATLLISSGCGVKETMLDRNWGKSFELAKSNQILNGPDEQVTEANIGKYRGYAEKQTSNKLDNSVIQSK